MIRSAVLALGIASALATVPVAGRRSRDVRRGAPSGNTLRGRGIQGTRHRQQRAVANRAHRPGLATSRIKDIAQLQSARDNQLVGYGLVIGLQGSGDSLRNSPFTEQSIRAMLENLGIATRRRPARAKNVAAVIVTANLPPFVQSGARIDVAVSSLGDAASLAGGTLIMTPLKAADGEIYAVAQGSGLHLGLHRPGRGRAADRKACRPPGACPTARSSSGRWRPQFGDLSSLVLQLRNPDFSTAVRIADAINDYALKGASANASRSEQDSRTVHHPEAERHQHGALLRRARKPRRRIGLRRPASWSTSAPAPSSSATRSRISRVAISHGTLTVRITEMPRVVQPEPFSRGETEVEPFTAIEADQPDGRVALLDGPDLETLVSGLNRLGVKPDGIIAILQGIKSAGALQADLVLQ